MVLNLLPVRVKTPADHPRRFTSGGAIAEGGRAKRGMFIHP
jgi:hypothetical protein